MGFSLYAWCFLKPKFLVKIYESLILKLVNIERENNIQDKKKCEKQDKSVLVKWTNVLISACLAWLECFT